MLKGQELLTKVNEMREAGESASAIARECGYSSVRENGTERLHFTEFYTELLTAQGKINKMVEYTIEDEDNEDVLRLIREGHPHDAIYTFIELYGEECVEFFPDSYQGEFQSGAEFAQYITEECYPMRDFPCHVVIDWEQTWDSGLRYDYDFQDGYIFYSNF
jgi:hypothetical protein